MSHPDADFLKKYLAPLKGATITAVKVSTEDEGEGLGYSHVQAWPTLVVKTKDGQTLNLEISQDEEGNGPGFIFGLPFPEAS